MSGAERPSSGGDWLGNARTFERHRRSALEAVLGAEKRGDEKAAAEMRTYAEGWRRERDRVQRQEENRVMNRRAHSRRMH